MTQSSPACPRCSQADKTYKVSLLYLESAARLNHHQQGDQPELDALLSDLSAETGSQANSHLTRFVQHFAPPKGEKRTTRRIHPDSTVIFFALLSMLFIYQVAVSQPSQLPIILILLVGGILAYVLARKSIIKRYEERVRQEKEENTRMETAVTNWMNLYFCSRDQGVFIPGQNRFAPLEQMSDLLKTE